MDVIELHRQLKVVEARIEAISSCPGLTPTIRAACLETCVEQGEQALDDAGEQLIAECFDWYVTFGEGGQVEELRDARFVYGLPAPGEGR